MTKLSNIQPVSTHTPTGFDPQFATAKPTEPVSADYAVKHAPSKGAAREMNYQECAQYSNEAVAAKKKKVDEEVDAVDIRYPHLEHAIETEADPPISRAEIRNVFLNRESPPYTKCSISLSENEFQTHTPSHLLYSFLDSLNRSSRSPR